MELIKRILNYVKPYRKRLATAIVAMMLHSFLTVLFIKVFKDLIDTMINNISNTGEGLVKLSWVAAGIIVVFFLKGIAYYAQKYLTSYVAQKAIRDVRNDLYHHLQHLSLKFYDKMNTGQIMSRVTNDVGKLQSAIVSGAIGIFYKTFTLVGGLGYLFYLSWKLALAIVIIFPPVTYVFIKFNKRIRKVSRRVQAKVADITEVLQETITGVRIVKAFGQEEYEYDKFSQENHENFRATMKNTQLSASLTPIVEILASFAFTFVLWYGGYEVIKGNMTPGELLAFFTLLITISGPIKSLSKLSNTIQQALAAADRIFEIMDLEVDIKEKKEAIELGEVDGKIEFKDVWFSYNEDEMVLKGIDLVANPGEVVALVGPSGAGKSTLVDLIPRFYDPQNGEVLIDGYNIKDLTIGSLRDKMGIVPQETMLFGGTVKDNIAYGSIDRVKEEVVAAAKAANAHEFIMEFSDGYDTAVSERGSSLSGGQRQRVAIARAILKDPKILILDEATSALDTESEALVQEALERLMQNRTTFVIAHRLSTILNADRIVVLDEGEIIETGTHEELLATGGLYSSLYEVQFAD
ncbi:lipid A export permease/ATP-binding protein MsbA [Selenihalanaerobacter shriftii]|uniref:ATP-binding cassette, subfamily B, MsbA n=1 Tax=Selenihalanaerobacter shriftii TaxID=142842 RepID=A0A1T4KYB2_9FIRM|nr:lipid A export permease/ATP-binding protein MsbA [Selenihalanaerobacter shriftii]SJZ47353.1 ATP-binding cassette, subfamily B, MsbA [Selenihalanaerobacter shriftii]